MPEICRFNGIVITMYWEDHPPPHFHARYGGHRATVAIDTGDLLSGSLPGPALRMVRNWADGAHEALVDNWERGRVKIPMRAIDPPD